MIEMSPYYAHSSPVGAVFDAATWSSRKALSMAVFGLVAGVGFAAATCYLVNPGLFAEKPPEVLKSLNEEIAKVKEEHPWGAAAGIGFVGFMAFVCLAGSLASFADGANPNYYFRAGPGGLSLRVPNGIDFGKLCMGFKVLVLDVAWDEVKDCTIVQKKQLGALSRNADNLEAYVRLKLANGSKHTFSLDCFREPARVIDSKLRDATQMVPAHFGPEPSAAQDAGATTTTTTSDKAQMITAALTELAGSTSGHTAVVLSDAATGKFVQFAGESGSLLLDVPLQTLSQTEQALATAFFQRIGEDLRQYDLLDRPGGAAVATQGTFQVAVGADAGRAAQLALDLFAQVYQLAPDFRLVVEEL